MIRSLRQYTVVLQKGGIVYANIYGNLAAQQHHPEEHCDIKVCRMQDIQVIQASELLRAQLISTAL